MSFPSDSFRFYFFQLTLSSIWKLFWFRAWGRALTYFFFYEDPFLSLQRVWILFRSWWGVSEESWAWQGCDEVCSKEGCCLWHLEMHTDGFWLWLSWSSYHTPYGIPIILEGCLWLWGIKEDPWTLQELIRETHQEFAPIQHLPEADWRHLMCVRDRRGSC